MTPRICRKDVSGLISTFLKSQLNCSLSKSYFSMSFKKKNATADAWVNRLAPQSGSGLIVQTLREIMLRAQRRAACGSCRNDSVIPRP